METQINTSTGNKQNDMTSKEELMELLKQNLTVRTTTKDVYNDGMDGSGQMYRQEFVVEIYFGGELVATSGY